MEEHGDALDLAVHHVLARRGSVLAVRSAPNLGPAEGVGAILRF
jgi:hypothetical protein